MGNKQERAVSTPDLGLLGFSDSPYQVSSLLSGPFEGHAGGPNVHSRVAPVAPPLRHIRFPTLSAATAAAPDCGHTDDTLELAYFILKD